MGTALLSALGVALVVIAGAIYLKPSWQTVLEEERIVIYRLGHFDRIAGPGLVFLLRRLDTIQRTLKVREEPHTYPVENLFIYGVPLGLIFSIWSTFDPTRVAGANRDEQLRLSLYSENERFEQMALILRSIVVQALAAIEQNQPLPAQANMGERIVSILPGFPGYGQIMDALSERLAAGMRSLGMILNPDRPLQITSMNVPESVRKGFDRERTMSFLRPQFPGLDDEALALLYTAVEKLDLPTIQRFRVQSDESLSTRIEQRTDNAQGGQIRVSMQKAASAAAAAAGQAPAPASAAAPAAQPASPSAPATEDLAPADLKVLKRVPREAPQRKAA